MRWYTCGLLQLLLLLLQQELTMRIECSLLLLLLLLLRLCRWLLWNLLLGLDLGGMSRHQEIALRLRDSRLYHNGIDIARRNLQDLIELL